MPHVYPHLKEKQTKTIIATLSLTGNLSSSFPPNCQEDADTRRMFYHEQQTDVLRPCCAVLSTPAAVQCCAFLCSAPFLSSLMLLLPLLLGFSVRQESPWRVGKLVFESSCGAGRTGLPSAHCRHLGQQQLLSVPEAAVMVFVTWRWSSGWKHHWRLKTITTSHFTWWKTLIQSLH